MTNPPTPTTPADLEAAADAILTNNPHPVTADTDYGIPWDLASPLLRDHLTDKLTNRQLEAFKLHMAGLSTIQIAVAMGTRKHTASELLDRCWQRLGGKYEPRQVNSEGAKLSAHNPAPDTIAQTELETTGADRNRTHPRLTATEARDRATAARNTDGEYQIGQRSPENDPERLAHIPAMVHDQIGIAVHVAGQWQRITVVRPTDTTGHKTQGLPGAMPGRGAPMDLKRTDHTIAQAERNADLALNTPPRTIPRPTNNRERQINQLATLTPLQRLHHLRGQTLETTMRPDANRNPRERTPVKAGTDAGKATS